MIITTFRQSMRTPGKQQVRLNPKGGIVWREINAVDDTITALGTCCTRHVGDETATALKRAAKAHGHVKWLDFDLIETVDNCLFGDCTGCDNHGPN